MSEYKSGKFGELFTVHTQKIGDAREVAAYLSGRIPLSDNTIRLLVGGLRRGNILGNVGHTTDRGAPVSYYALRLFNVLNILNVQRDSEMIVIARNELGYNGDYPPIESFPVFHRGYVSPKSKARTLTRESSRNLKTLTRRILALPDDQRSQVETFIDSL